jgi:hypothetical protein
MTARELIAKAAEEAGFTNKSTHDEQTYWNVDQWKSGRKYLRVNFDARGRVRSASWGNGRTSKFFGGYQQKQQILNKISAWTESK